MQIKTISEVKIFLVKFIRNLSKLADIVNILLILNAYAGRGYHF